jgi:hypothetical protein
MPSFFVMNVNFANFHRAAVASRMSELGDVRVGPPPKRKGAPDRSDAPLGDFSK